MTGLLERIKDIINRLFNVKIETFFAAIRLSPNAQGYIGGAITELLLKENLEKNNYELLRIKEKWEGKKHPNHHGDFYFRKKTNKEWFVLESKGVKSNSEKWHRLYNFEQLKGFLIKHKDKITWLKNSKTLVEYQIEEWIRSNLPKFYTDYKDNLYTYDEVKKYIAKPSKKETAKSKTMHALKNFNTEKIDELIKERLNYLLTAIRVLETHFVSGTSEVGDRTQATPRNDEFNIMAIDLYLRTGNHEFIFANPKELEPSSSDRNHLQQNYIIGFIFPKEKGADYKLVDEVWYNTFEEAFHTLKKEDAVNEKGMQIDYRAQELEKEAEEELETTR